MYKFQIKKLREEYFKENITYTELKGRIAEMNERHYNLLSKPQARCEHTVTKEQVSNGNEVYILTEKEKKSDKFQKKLTDFNMV